jgi:endonuclease III
LDNFPRNKSINETVGDVAVSEKPSFQVQLDKKQGLNPFTGSSRHNLVFENITQVSRDVSAQVDPESISVPETGDGLIENQDPRLIVGTDEHMAIKPSSDLEENTSDTPNYTVDTANGQSLSTHASSPPPNVRRSGRNTTQRKPLTGINLGDQNDQAGPPKKQRKTRNSQSVAKSSPKVRRITTRTKKQKFETLLAMNTENSGPPAEDEVLQSRLITTPTLSTAPPDGNFQDWISFGDKGNYDGLTANEWDRVRCFASVQRSESEIVTEAVIFHSLVVTMKDDLGLVSARDCWSQVLPAPHLEHYPMCLLFLMICTPLVPDTKIVELFRPIFDTYIVDEDWIIAVGEERLQVLLQPLGRQKQSAEYVIGAAHFLKQRNGRFPRDYRELLHIKGVGPKVALVTIQEAYGIVQGIPCDVHMCRIFTRLGWVPTPESSGTMVSFLNNTKKESHNYELCRAAMEGWFPKRYWGTMNQTWAGLGQLLNDNDSKHQIAQYIDNQVADYRSGWRVADKQKFFNILEAYTR